jgi:LCP family protein required for cell wall assembly
VLLSAGVTVVVIALLGAAGVYYLLRAIGNIDRTDVDVDAVAEGEPRNYLVVGSDVRTDGSVSGRRSDTIMVVRLDPASEAASVLSFPRDLNVTIAGSGDEARINSAYSSGDTVEQGRQTLIDTLRQNFGIEINHYLEIDFQGFQQLVDAIGGVNIWVERAIKDDHSGLFVPDLGCVTLNGEQALAFARSRHLQYMEEDGTWSGEDPYADRGRIDRQQVFIRRAIAKALSAAKSNPLRVRDIIGIGTESVTIDQNTDPLALFDQFRDFDLNNLNTYNLPVVDSGDGATVDLDREGAEPILNVFRGLPPGEMSPGLITVSVYNTTATDGLANDAAGAFRAVGFEMGEVTNLPEPHPNTTVYHLPGEENRAVRVARHIGDGSARIQVREDLDLESGEVAVVIGDDFIQGEEQFTQIHTLPVPLEEMATTTTTAAGGAPPPGDTGGEAGGGGGGDAGATPTTTPESTTTTVPPPTTVTDEEFRVGEPPPGVNCDA